MIFKFLCIHLKPNYKAKYYNINKSHIFHISNILINIFNNLVMQ